MTENASERAERLFAAALEREPGERERYLAEACADDPQLRDEIAQWLRGADQAFDYFDELEERVGEGLADDLKQAALLRSQSAGDPPSPPVATERTGRSGRRGATLAVVALAALGAGAVAGAWWQRSSVSRDDVGVERLGRMLLPADESVIGHPSLSAQELLDAAVVRIRTELADRPATRAHLFGSVGRIYDHLGLDGQARQVFEDALRAAREADSTPAGLADAYHDLGRVLREQGDADSAAAHLREALRLDRARGGAPDERTARDLLALGRALADGGELDAAVPLLDESLSIRAERFEPTDSRVVESTVERAWLEQRRGNLAGATELLDASLQGLREAIGDDHPRYLATLEQRARLHESAGERAVAESTYRAILAARRRSLSPDHPLTANTLIDLARVIAAGAEPDEAAALLREAQAIRRQHPPAGDK